MRKSNKSCKEKNTHRDELWGGAELVMMQPWPNAPLKTHKQGQEDQHRPNPL